MPVHDWTRVSSNTFHGFRVSWISELRKALNTGVLPTGYYADAERVVRSRSRRLVIRHTSDHHAVAFVAVAWQADKRSPRRVRTFADKAVGVLELGIHVTVIDLLPPGPHDPAGLHGEIWTRFGGSYTIPPGRPRTLASYAADPPDVKAFVEHVTVGDELPSIPQVLTPGRHILLPLEATYAEAWQATPRIWREQLTAPLERREGRGSE